MSTSYKPKQALLQVLTGALCLSVYRASVATIGVAVFRSGVVGPTSLPLLASAVTIGVVFLLDAAVLWGISKIGAANTGGSGRSIWNASARLVLTCVGCMLVMVAAVYLRAHLG